VNITCAISGCEEQATDRPYRIAENVCLNLCQPHSYDVASRTKERARQAIADLDAIGGISKHTPGWTYVIRLSDGVLKIGMTEGGIAKRLQDLTTKYSAGVPVMVLAVVEGGESREKLYHHQWAHLRIPGTMEAFHQDPSLIRWAEELGIDPGSDVEKYDGYIERRHQAGKAGADVEAMFGDAQEQMNRLRKSEDESFWG